MSYFLCHAAGIKKGAMKPGICLFFISVPELHLYFSLLWFNLNKCLVSIDFITDKSSWRFLSIRNQESKVKASSKWIIFSSIPGEEIAGKVTLKHVYEIAKIKSEDPCWENTPLESICKSIISAAHTCGIEVVRNLDPQEYGEFLEERRRIVQEQEDELLEARQAKLMRVA